MLMMLMSILKTAKNLLQKIIFIINLGKSSILYMCVCVCMCVYVCVCVCVCTHIQGGEKVWKPLEISQGK